MLIGPVKVIVVRVCLDGSYPGGLLINLHRAVAIRDRTPVYDVHPDRKRAGVKVGAQEPWMLNETYIRLSVVCVLCVFLFSVLVVLCVVLFTIRLSFAT